MAGILIKNKQVTFSFLIENGKHSDSLHVLSKRGEKTIQILAAPIRLPDTTVLSVSVKGDSLSLGAAGIMVSIGKPLDFSSLETVGFECPHGNVQVFEAAVETKNKSYRESFEKATLVNLHLEKMFPGSKEDQKGEEH